MVLGLLWSFEATKKLSRLFPDFDFKVSALNAFTWRQPGFSRDPCGNCQVQAMTLKFSCPLWDWPLPPIFLIWINRDILWKLRPYVSWTVSVKEIEHIKQKQAKIETCNRTHHDTIFFIIVHLCCTTTNPLPRSPTHCGRTRCAPPPRRERCPPSRPDDVRAARTGGDGFSHGCGRFQNFRRFGWFISAIWASTLNTVIWTSNNNDLS